MIVVAESVRGVSVPTRLPSFIECPSVRMASPLLKFPMSGPFDRIRFQFRRPANVTLSAAGHHAGYSPTAQVSLFLPPDRGHHVLRDEIEVVAEAIPR
jgi:hypothetical protein